eukprot:scaffold6813_cov123-Isochrysis_galbana.AAC.6
MLWTSLLRSWTPCRAPTSPLPAAPYAGGESAHRSRHHHHSGPWHQAPEPLFGTVAHLPDARHRRVVARNGGIGDEDGAQICDRHLGKGCDARPAPQADGGAGRAGPPVASAALVGD